MANYLITKKIGTIGNIVLTIAVRNSGLYTIWLIPGNKHKPPGWRQKFTNNMTIVEIAAVNNIEMLSPMYESKIELWDDPNNKQVKFFVKALFDCMDRNRTNKGIHELREKIGSHWDEFKQFLSDSRKIIVTQELMNS
jgi:hypothetical protein